jgi:hypothetical protein
MSQSPTAVAAPANERDQILSAWVSAKKKLDRAMAVRDVIESAWIKSKAKVLIARKQFGPGEHVESECAFDAAREALADAEKDVHDALVAAKAAIAAAEEIGITIGVEL